MHYKGLAHKFKVNINLQFVNFDKMLWQLNKTLCTWNFALITSLVKFLHQQCDMDMFNVIFNGRQHKFEKKVEMRNK